jgi:glutamyl-tRNA reductase
MQIAVVGVNFRQAAVEMREQFILRSAQLFQHPFSAIPHVILTTCNRAEIYFSCAHLEIVQELVFQELEHIYTFANKTCFVHLAKVTAGIDSAILGESEIQRQVKESYELAAKEQTLPPDLHFLFQKALRIGKIIRSHRFYQQPYGLKEVVSHFLSRYVAPTDPILFIGYSEINRRIIKHFLQMGISSISLCTKSPSAVTLKNIEVIDHQRMHQWVTYPVVIVGVKETKYLLTKPEGKVETECLIDLGVPRGVDPSLAPLVKKGLWNIDHLIDFQKKEFLASFDITPLETRITAKVEEYYAAYQKRKKLSRRSGQECAGRG